MKVSCERFVNVFGALVTKPLGAVLFGLNLQLYLPNILPAPPFSPP